MIGDFLVAEPFEVKHHHRLALAFGESIDGSPKPFFSSLLLDLFVERWGWVHQPVHRLSLLFIMFASLIAGAASRSLSCAHLVDGNVAGDAQQPGAQRLVRPQA